MMIVNDVHFEGGINFERDPKTAHSQPGCGSCYGSRAVCGAPAAAETSTPETAQEDSGVPYDVANGLENSFRYKDGVPIYDDSVPAIEWEDIVQQDAATYSSNGIATCSVTYNGFDVSYHQGTVDWDAVKNSGIDFVMIRCGIGSEYDGVGENKQDDAQWYRNVSECERLGIPYGVYLYSYAENTDMAASEARHTLSL